MNAWLWCWSCVTPPQPVPIPDEKRGGLVVGLALPPCKKKKKSLATETPMKVQETSTASLDAEGSSLWRVRTLSGDSRGENHMADHPSLDQENHRRRMDRVRTVDKTGKTEQIVFEMKSCKLTLLGNSETKWTQSGQRILQTGETLLLSANRRDAVVLSKQERRCCSQQTGETLLFSENRRDAVVLRTRRQHLSSYPPPNTHRQWTNHAIKISIEGINKMESLWAKNHHDILQNKEKEDQD